MREADLQPYARRSKEKTFYSHWVIQPKHTKRAHSKKKNVTARICPKTPKHSLVYGQKLICRWYVELLSQLRQTRNRSTNKSLRYSVFLQEVGTKKPVTQPRLEQHKCEMKKGMEKKKKKNPQPNSIFGLGGDLASFNLELFAYSEQWDHHSLQLCHKAGLVAFGAKPQRLPAPTERWLWKQVRVLQFGALQLFSWHYVPDSLISGRTIYWH